MPWDPSLFPASDRLRSLRCSGFLRSLVKRRWNYPSLALLRANFHKQTRAYRGKRRRHVGQSDVFAECGRRQATSDHADGLAGFIANAVLVTRDAPVDHLEANQCARQARSLGPLERGSPDEIALLHLAIAVEAGFPDVDFVADFVAVERHLGFQAQRVART